MKPEKTRAVIFDLFGTLVPSFSQMEYRQLLDRIAERVSVPPDQFWNGWAATFEDSILGILPDPQAQIVRVCRELGLAPAPGIVQEAAGLFLEYEALTMIPRAGSVDVMDLLKKTGYKIGLISDCSYAATVVWDNTPLAPFFDVTVFSCREGLRKPDPRIYQLALKKLDVSPGDCCYIGDGSSRELSGASQVGLRAIHLHIPAEQDPDVYRLDLEDWQGEYIESLEDIIPLLLGKKGLIQA